MTYSFTVGDSDIGLSVGEFLKHRCGLSRRHIIKLKQLDNGITKNGIHARVTDSLSAGDVVAIRSEEQTQIEPNKNLCVPVVFEDEHIVVFDKPHGMPVHPSHLHKDDTLANYFSYLYPGLTFRSINRLDRDTSGLCVCAKSRLCANSLQGRVQKVYSAAVCGRISECGRVDAPIAREQESIITRCVRSDGKRSVTDYRPILQGEGYTLLEIHLETGRTHQIRVHMAYIGHPLAGDTLYGTDRSIPRQALHCSCVSFSHPITGDRVELHSPIPEDIMTLFKENNYGENSKL